MNSPRKLTSRPGAVVLGLATGQCSAFAQGKGLDEPFRAAYMKALNGKTVGYIPCGPWVSTSRRAGTTD